MLATQGAPLDLSDALVRDMMPDAADCPGTPPEGRGVGFGLPPSIEIEGVHGRNAFGKVSHVVVDGYTSVGLAAVGSLGGASTSMTFTDNVVRPGAPVISTEQLSIEVASGALARVNGNTVTGAAPPLARESPKTTCPTPTSASINCSARTAAGSPTTRLAGNRYGPARESYRRPSRTVALARTWRYAGVSDLQGE